MSQWLITGANRKSGKSVAFKIRADSADEAQRKANQNGFLIEDVKPWPSTPVTAYVLCTVGAVAIIGLLVFLFFTNWGTKLAIADLRTEVARLRDAQKQSDARAAVVPKPAAPPPPTAPVIKPLDFAWNDPIGSFTVVGAGRLNGNDFFVDIAKWILLQPVQQKRVADAIWDQMVATTRNQGESEAALLEMNGETEGSKLIQEGWSLKGQLLKIETKKQADLRRVRIGEEISKTVIHVYDAASRTVLAQRTIDGFVIVAH